VSYRNRVQEIHVPDIEALPTWGLDEVGPAGAVPGRGGGGTDVPSVSDRPA
jgi:hypothetical protein